MKTRYVIIMLMFLVLIGLVCAEQIFVRNTINLMKLKVNDLIVEIDSIDAIDNQSVTQKIQDLDYIWMQKEQVLCLIVNHKDMENVGEQIAKLKTLISQNNKQKAEQELDLLNYYIDCYEHFVSISWQNLF